MTKTRLEVWHGRCRIRNILLRNLLVEFVATTMLMYLGLTLEAQQTLNGWLAKTHLANAVGWGLALVLAVQIAWNVTGSHLNPAVSFNAWTFGQLPFCHFLLYSLAQTAGGYFGALLTYFLYFDKIEEFDGGIRSVSGPTATAGIFSTFPGAHLSTFGAIIDQISSSAVLCFCLGIITDKGNKIPKVAQPAMIGLMLASICSGFALNTGNAMNPARDLGPRIFTFFAGYGWEVFSYQNYTWFWIPVLCPFIGGFIGAWAYQLLIAPQIYDGGAVEREREKEAAANGLQVVMIDQHKRTYSSSM